MDSRYYQDKINRLDKDIADIEKKIAAESKIEADRSSKIAADGAAKCNELLPFLNNEEKLKEYFQRYQDMCQELGKYIIL